MRPVARCLSSVESGVVLNVERCDAYRSSQELGTFVDRRKSDEKPYHSKGHAARSEGKYVLELAVRLAAPEIIHPVHRNLLDSLFAISLVA
jgi:mRNA degradation ribonuclease J1/J2